jgi:GntR family transcriptional regulator, vanillate catabolism transcriptional regulator
MSDLKNAGSRGPPKLTMDGHFIPESRLAECAIAAKRLAVSRTPVRVQFPLLAQEGLLLPSGSGGYVVRSFTEDAISDAIDVRGTTGKTRSAAVGATRLVRSHGHPVQACLSEGDAILSVGKIEPGGFPRLAEMKIEFHHLIVEGSGNETVRRALAVNDGMPFSPASSVAATCNDALESYHDLVHSHYHHHAIVEALLEGESVRAEALVKEHSNATKRIVPRMRKLRDFPRSQR